MQMRSIGFSQFKEVVRIYYKEGGHPGRDFYLWQGDVSQIQAFLPENITVYKSLEKDVFCDCTEIPRGENQIADYIKEKMESFLTNMRCKSSIPHILVLTDFFLLMRYRIDISFFFDNYCNSDKTFLIVCFKPFYDDTSVKFTIPCISYEPEKLVNYFDHQDIFDIEVSR